MRYLTPSTSNFPSKWFYGWFLFSVNVPQVKEVSLSPCMSVNFRSEETSLVCERSLTQDIAASRLFFFCWGRGIYSKVRAGILFSTAMLEDSFLSPLPLPSPPPLSPIPPKKWMCSYSFRRWKIVKVTERSIHILLAFSLVKNSINDTEVALFELLYLLKFSN